MKKKKYLILVLILILAGAILAGLVLLLNGRLLYFSTGMNKNTIMKLDGEKTYKFEAQILMSEARAQYEEMFGTSIWEQEIDGTSFEEYVKEQIKVKLLRVRCMNKMAKERGVVLGREEKNNVSTAVDKYYSSLKEAEIKELAVTKEDLTIMFTEFAIAEKLYQDIISTYDIEISADDARVIDIQYIVCDSEEDILKAQKELERGTSFFSVAKSYNDGEYEYELRRGEMDESFEEAAFNLATGDTSSVINAGDKYYIVRCISDNDKSKTEVNKEELLKKKQLELFNESFAEYEAGIYIEINNKVWDSLCISKSSIYSADFETIFSSYIAK